MEQGTSINADTIIGDVLESCPAAKPVIEKYFGTTCFTCPGMKMESLSDGAMMHNVDVNEVLKELQEKCGGSAATVSGEQMGEPSDKAQQESQKPVSRDTGKCLVCGATSDEQILLKAERDGKPADVCVKCLPRLIHGQE